VQGTESPFGSYGELVFNVLQVFYFVAMLTVLVSSLGNRPKGSKRLYYSISVFFAIIMALMLSMSIYSMKAAFDSLNQKSVWSNAQFRDIVVGLGTTYFSYVLASCLYMDAAHIITSQAQALLLYPTYVNVFLTFSFSNLHDISWGGFRN
jgi:chitin synthase